MGKTKASPARSTALRNPTKLDKQNSFQNKLRKMKAKPSILKITRKAFRLRKLA
jgi:hypothetical protein